MEHKERMNPRKHNPMSPMIKNSVFAVIAVVCLILLGRWLRLYDRSSQDYRKIDMGAELIPTMKQSTQAVLAQWLDPAESCTHWPKAFHSLWNQQPSSKLKLQVHEAWTPSLPNEWQTLCSFQGTAPTSKSSICVSLSEFQAPLNGKSLDSLEVLAAVGLGFWHPLLQRPADCETFRALPVHMLHATFKVWWRPKAEESAAFMEQSFADTLVIGSAK